MSYRGKNMQRIWLILAFMMLIAILIPLTGGQQTATEWIENGKTLYNQGKYDDAILAYENATELVTENTSDELANAWYELGKTFSSRGMNDNASRCFENAISLEPKKYYWCDYGSSSKFGGYEGTWRGVSRLCRGTNDNTTGLNETATMPVAA